MDTQHFTLHQVTDGVWEAEGDFSKASIGNAAIVDAGGKTIVIDTFMTQVAAAELREAAEALTGNSVFLAVNTHWHSDHASGNQVFDDVPIVSTSQTRDEIARTAPADVAAWEPEIEAAIARLEAAVAAGDDAASDQLTLQRHFKAHTTGFRMTLPSLLIDGTLTVEGERRVEIMTLGRGHTVSDTIVWLPAERVVITGDLCWRGIHPRTQDGFPTDWATYAEALIALEPKHVIPGHGLPGGPEALTTLPSYFRTVAEMVEAVRTGADPTSFEAPQGSSDWEGLARFHTGLRILAQQ
jgi:glyoxylase-like metal-dependent hydrolase (beta-lactamase superfamily II)